jgi:hypothetical protein
MHGAKQQSKESKSQSIHTWAAVNTGTSCGLECGRRCGERGGWGEGAKSRVREVSLPPHIQEQQPRTPVLSQALVNSAAPPQSSP